ncbi:MAG: PA14 domain-containing protein, partial [Anaerolineae bacterium]
LETPTPTPPPTATPVPTWTPVPVQPTDTPEPPLVGEWRAEYFANPMLEGLPALTRLEPQLEIDWALGSPGEGIPVDGFSARFSRDFVALPGLYRIYLQVDDGARVWLDGTLLIDEWHAYTGDTYVAEADLGPGTNHMLVEYYENVSVAHIYLWVEPVR